MSTFENERSMMSAKGANSTSPLLNNKLLRLNLQDCKSLSNTAVISRKYII